MYAYYMTQRPVDIGAQPKGMDHFEDYGKRIYIPEIDRKAWSKIYYTRDLTDTEVYNYELVKAKGE